MKIIVIIFIFFSNFTFSITFEELDFFRSLTTENSPSIIENGNNYCNDYFDTILLSNSIIIQTFQSIPSLFT